MSETVEKAFAILSALTKKMPDRQVRLVYHPLRPDKSDSRKVFEFYLCDGGKIESCTAYTEGWFDTETMPLPELGKRIYKELVQRFEWEMVAHK